MQDDNIEAFTLDSSLILDDSPLVGGDDSPLIDEYLASFSPVRKVVQPESSPTRTIDDSYNLESNNNNNRMTSPTKVPSLREKLQVLLDKAHNERKEKASKTNYPEEGEAIVVPSSPPPTNGIKRAEVSSITSPSTPSEFAATTTSPGLFIPEPLTMEMEQKNQEQPIHNTNSTNHSRATTVTATPSTSGSIERINFIQSDTVLEQQQQEQHLSSTTLSPTTMAITLNSNQELSEKLPPKSKPEFIRVGAEEQKMNVQQHINHYNINHNNNNNNKDQEYYTVAGEGNKSIEKSSSSESSSHHHLIRVNEEDHQEDEQHDSFATEEKHLNLSDDEEDVTGREMEDLTLSKLNTSTVTTTTNNLDQSTTSTLMLQATRTPPPGPTRTTSPTRSRPQSSLMMRSGTPNYMNSTRASTSKEVSRSSIDLRASASDTKMRFGMVNYQQRPPSATRSPSPSVLTQKRRVTPRKDRIYNVVPTLQFEDISVTTGLGTISVPNYRLTSLKGLGVKRDLKILYLQNNYLTSFNHLETQPNLEVLYVANNCISSFYGFKSQPKLTLISMEGNPITKHPHYRLMALIICGNQLKKIDGEMVEFREREFVKQYLTANERAVEAIRSGWLMDMSPRTSDDFQDLIQELSLQNFDDREAIRNSQLFQDLVSGALSKSTPAVDLDNFEEKKKKDQQQVVQQSSSDHLSHSFTNNGFNSAFLTNYINEIKQLKAQLEKKAEELKEEKQKYKDLKESSLGIEEFNLIEQSIISNIGISIGSTSEIEENVILSFGIDSMELSTPKQQGLKDIQYEKVTRTSLLVDEQKLFRVHVRMNNSELLDIITADKKKSLSIYKILHMKVAHANKQKKLRQHQAAATK